VIDASGSAGIEAHPKMRSTDQIKRTLRGPDYVEKPIDRAVSQPIVGRVFRPAVAEGASEEAPYK
jgi:hypothetical protein